jgi:hypothetical protein
MRIGASLCLIAEGVILRFAINPFHPNTHGFDIGATGVLLMIVGAVGLIISLVLMSTQRRADDHARPGDRHPAAHAVSSRATRPTSDLRRTRPTTGDLSDKPRPEPTDIVPPPKKSTP